MSQEAGRDHVSDPASQLSVGGRLAVTYMRWGSWQHWQHGQFAGQHGGLAAGPDLLGDLLLPLLALGPTSELAGDGLYQGS